MIFSDHCWSTGTLGVFVRVGVCVFVFPSIASLSSQKPVQLHNKQEVVAGSAPAQIQEVLKLLEVLEVQQVLVFGGNSTCSYFMFLLLQHN